MDDILVKRAQKGDKECFSSIVMPLRDDAYRIAYCYLHNENDSMDAVCDAVEKALINIRHLKETKYFKTWFIRIVINECKLQLREKEKLISLSEKLIKETPQHNNISEEELDIKRLLASLEPMEGLIIHLKYYMGYTLAEISRILDVPEGTVKTKLYTNLKLMRNSLLLKEE